MNRLVALVALTLALAAPFLATSSAHAASRPRTIMTARLYGPEMYAKAKYEKKHKSNGRVRERLTVEVKYAMPFASYEVKYGHRQLGFVQTNAAGRGKLRLEGSWLPNVKAGKRITVGSTMAGIFVSREKRLRNRAQHYRVRADLDGESAASGHAKYRHRFKRGKLRRDFQVEIEDAVAFTTYEVDIDGLVVGEVTTDGFGRGELHLRTRSFIDDDDDDVLPMPSSFPTVLPGDRVTVGPVSGRMRRD